MGPCGESLGDRCWINYSFQLLIQAHELSLEAFLRLVNVKSGVILGIFF